MAAGVQGSRSTTGQRLLASIAIVGCALVLLGSLMLDGNGLVPQSSQQSRPPSKEAVGVFDASFAQQIGQAEIDQAHRQALPHKGTIVFVYRHDVESREPFSVATCPNVLLLRRSLRLITCPGSWSFFGEHTWPNETPQQTASRGLKEELGVSVSNDRFAKLTSLIFDFAIDESGVRRENQLTTILTLNLTSQSPDTSPVKITVDPEETDMIEWVPVGELERQINERPIYCIDVLRNPTRKLVQLFCETLPDECCPQQGDDRT